MKKTLVTALACVAIILGFTSCPNSPDPTPTPTPTPHVAKVVDLRNKDVDGNVIGRAADTPVEFSYKLLNYIECFEGRTNTPTDIDGGALSRITKKVAGEEVMHTMYVEDGETVDNEFKTFTDSISFKDDEDGVKLVFTKPEGYDNLKWMVFQYIDNNGNRSTAMSSDRWDELFGAGSFEMVYPLVKTGVPAHFWIMFGNENDEQYGVSLFYEIMPEHGQGCVDDMQADYCETDYASIEGSKLKMQLTIPPKAENLYHIINLHEQKAADKAWGEFRNEDGTYDSPTGLGGIREAASEAEETAAAEGTEFIGEFDLKDYTGSSDSYDGSFSVSNAAKPYIFTEFMYEYTMPDHPGFVFQSPAVKPVPVANPFISGAAD